MKKTLAAIFALACATASASDWTYNANTVGDLSQEVSGSDILSWDVLGSDLTWTGAHAFSIAISLDVSSLSSDAEYAVMSIKDVTYNGLAAVAIQNGSINFVNWNNTAPIASLSLDAVGAEKTLTLVLSRDASNALTLGVYADGDFDNGTTLAGRTGFLFGDKNFTAINVGGTTESSYFQNVNSVMPSNDEAAAFTVTGLAYVTGGVATAEQLSAYYTNTVPEPATATLSLLALAGLAARRRRK